MSDSNRIFHYGLDNQKSDNFPYSGLILYYKLDNVNDYLGNNNLTNEKDQFSGTDYVLFQAGKINNGARFNGANLLTHSNISALNFGTGDFTISFWIKPVDTTQNNAGIISQFTSDHGFALRYSGTSKKLTFQTERISYSTDTTVPAGEWTYYTIRRISGVLQWYKNSSTDCIEWDNTNDVHSTAPFRIGRWLTATYYYTGDLDEIGIWNRALTTDEIALLYNSGNGLTPA